MRNRAGITGGSMAGMREVIFSNVTRVENRRGCALGHEGYSARCFRTKDNYEHTHPLRGSARRLVGSRLGKEVKRETDPDPPRGRPAGVAA